MNSLPAAAHFTLYVSTLIIFAGLATATPLEYAPAPPGNPLKGLVPYVSASAKNRFPHSMEFRYFSLREIMPGPQQFDWSPIENTLKQVNRRGTHLIFRIYCEYPGKAIGVPQFLIEQSLKITEWTNPHNGQVSHTPDYDNVEFRAAMKRCIVAMGDRFDGDPRIAFITAGFLGSWGEWHTHPRDDLWPSQTVQREVMDSFERAFAKTKVLLRYPAGEDAEPHAANHDRPFGYHDDSFCWATLDTGSEADSWFFEPSMAAAGTLEKWKHYPVGGEIRPELWGRTFTEKRHPRDQGFVECVQKMHVTWLMDSGLFDSRFPMDDRRKQTALREVSRMGYDLHVSKADWQNGILTLAVENRGVAPFYYDWPVEIKTAGKVRQTDWKISHILPGEPEQWTLTTSAIQELKIRIPNPMPGGKPLRFANRNQGASWLKINL